MTEVPPVNLLPPRKPPAPLAQTDRDDRDHERALALVEETRLLASAAEHLVNAGELDLAAQVGIAIQARGARLYAELA